MSGVDRPTYKVSGDFVFGSRKEVSSRARHIGGVFLRRALNALNFDHSTMGASSDSSDPDSCPPSPSICGGARKGRQFHAGFTIEPDDIRDVFSAPRVRKFLHRKVVESVCWSPDGRFLATGSRDKTARIYDVATGKEIFKSKEFGTLVSGVNSVCFSPSGRHIAIGSGDGFARVLSVRTGAEIMKTTKHGNVLSSVNFVSFAPDGQSIATASHDKFARIFLLKNGREVFKSREHGSYVTCVCFSPPDGAYIATGCHDTFLRIMDARNGHDVFEPIKHGGIVQCVCFSFDGKIIASGSSECVVRLFHAATCYELLKITELTGEVLSLSFSRDNRKIAAACTDNNVHIFDVDSGKKILCNMGHTGYVTCCAFSPDGRSIASGSKDNIARVFDLDAGKNSMKTFESNSSVTCFCLSPDGRKLATSTCDNIVCIFDIQSGRKILQTIAHGHIICSMCFAPDGLSIVTGCHDGFARIFDISSGQQTLKMIDVTLEDHHMHSPGCDPIVKYYWTSHVEEYECHDTFKPIVVHSRNQLSPVKSLRYNKSSANDDFVQLTQPVIESHFNRILMSQYHHDKVTHVTFSIDGKKIATGCSDKFVRIFEVGNGTEILKFIAAGDGGEISSIGFSSDCNRVVTSSMETSVRIVDLSTGNQLLKTFVHESKVLFACFLPNSKSLAICIADATARIFDLENGKETFATISHGGLATYFWSSPDEKFFVTCSTDRFIRIFLHQQPEQVRKEVNPCVIFPGKMISFSVDGTAWRLAFDNNNSVHVILRPFNAETDSSLPVSSEFVLLWSSLNRDLQLQWFFSDAKVVHSEFTAPDGAALVALASKWNDSSYPYALPTLKRLCQTDEPVVNAGLILRELLSDSGTKIADAEVISALLRNVGRHMKYATRDDILAQQLIRAARVPGVQHIIHEFWKELAGPVPSHPITIRNVHQVSFSRMTRLYVTGSDSAFEPVFETYFRNHSQVRGLSLEFEHWLVPFPNPSARQDVSDVKKKSLMQELVETNDIDLSDAFFIARAIVQFKWQMYGLKHWMREFYIYIINLGLLVALSIMMWQENHESYNFDSHPSTFIVSALIGALDVRSVYREAKQFVHGIPVDDGKTSMLQRIKNSSHYAHGREFWNWVELLHIVLGFSVVVLVWAQSPDALPVLSATCFLRWWGLLFYIQASVCP
jgi:WD40 repeat protein